MSNLAKRASQAVPVAVAMIAIACFALLIAWIYLTVLDSGRQQRALRIAEDQRALTLRLQLDQETALRGYTSTANGVFLQPYRDAASRIEPALTAERAALAGLANSVNLAPLVDRQLALHREWDSTVAKPLREDPFRADGPTLQLQGKSLIDQFRRIDAQITSVLFKASEQADGALRTTLARIIAVGLIGSVTIVAAALMIVRSAERAQREIEKQRTLYETERRIATTLQRAFLRRELPKLPSLTFSAVYMPAEQQASVGGDWYDAFELPDGRIFFTVGDVCGHGVEAAVTMG